MGSEKAQKLDRITLFSNTVQRRIEDKTIDVEKRVVKDLKKSRYFAIQIDQSTDLSDCAILCFVRYAEKRISRKNFYVTLTYHPLHYPSEVFSCKETYNCYEKYVEQRGEKC